MPSETLLALTAYAAGAILLFSIIPDIWRCGKSVAKAMSISLTRTALQCAGNALWLVHGLAADNPRLAAMTAIGATLALVLFALGWAARRRMAAVGGRAGC